jgi:hypothetical protein
MVFGKLYVQGGIDPTYLALTPQGSDPLLPLGLDGIWIEDVPARYLHTQSIFLNDGTTAPFIQLNPTGSPQIFITDGLGTGLSVNTSITNGSIEIRDETTTPDTTNTLNASTITLTNGTTTNTIDINGYTTQNSVENATKYLNFSDISANGISTIKKTSGISCNPSTNTITATTFVGDLSGNTTTATRATNIAGGAGGEIPYQSAVNTTAFLANGSSGQFLKSLGGTNPPFWDSLPVASTPTLSQVLAEGNSAGTFDIDMSGNDITNATSITSTTFVGDLSGNATTATNISGGSGGQVLYQSASGTTAKLANGTSGQVLTSAGTTLAPTWTTPSGGASANSVSQTYSNDYAIEAVGDYSQYPLFLTTYISGSTVNVNYTGRFGVRNFTTGGAATSTVSQRSFTIGSTASTPNLTLSMLNQDTNGLGWSMIFNTGTNVAGQYQLFAGFAGKINENPPVEFSDPAPRAVFWRQWANTGDWGCKLGNSATQFFTGSGTATNQFLAVRLVPTATGVIFYLYNQTTSTSYTPITILYSATSGAGLTSATTPMFYGFQVMNAPATFGTATINVDFMGLQITTPRIYS